MTESRAKDWLAQAENDYQWGCDSCSQGHFAQTCFIAQQVAEKCLKSLAYLWGAELVKGHSVLSITRELKINGELETYAKRLDQYYISTRYPDAQPSGAPYEYFTREQAEEALRFAKAFIEKSKANFATS